eukprot:Gb_29775 [translate_table: standard]
MKEGDKEMRAVLKKVVEDPEIGEGRKGLASLEALEAHVKQIAEQRIDHQLSELDENDGQEMELTRFKRYTWKHQQMKACANTLPTPIGGRSTSVTGGVNNSAIDMKLSRASGVVNSQWHTSPLEQCNTSTKSDTNLCNSENSISSPLMRESYISKGQSISEESTTRTRAKPMPLPSSIEKVPQLKLYATVVHCDLYKWNLRLNQDVLVVVLNLVHLFLQKSPPSFSPYHLSPPRISEFHELPRPPGDLGQPLKPTSSLAHSAPLIARRSQEPSTIKMPRLTISKPASPLPLPPPRLKWMNTFKKTTNDYCCATNASCTLTNRPITAANNHNNRYASKWYNFIVDLPEPPPPTLNPKTCQLLKPEDLFPLFPKELIVLEKMLGTPSRIYYKYEGVKSLVTESGAGQWGSALALACNLFDLQCKVWQVRTSYDQKPYRKMMMETWGAKVHLT